MFPMKTERMIPMKPITERELLPAVQLSYARWREMQTIQQELKHTQEKLKYQKIIANARTILAKQNNISDYQAHQQLIHESMSFRITLVERAVQIVRQSKREEEART